MTKPNNGRKHRPSISMRQSTYDRLDLGVALVGGGLSRTGLAEVAINEYLDARGVPIVEPASKRREAPLPTASLSTGPSIERAREVLARLSALRAQAAAYEERVAAFLVGGPDPDAPRCVSDDDVLGSVSGVKMLG